MTETIEWEAVRAKAVRGFAGELPRADTESAIIDVFEVMPEAVLAAIVDCTELKAEGKIRSGWAVLHKRLEDALEPGRNVTATLGQDRALRVRQAEAWIRTAGLHCLDEAEVVHELYEARSNGHRNSSQALLAPWRDDEQLRERIVALWRSERPNGERADLELVERAERWKDAQARLRAPVVATDDDIPF